MTDDLFLLLVVFAVLSVVVVVLGAIEWLYYKMFETTLSDESEETKR